MEQIHNRALEAIQPFIHIATSNQSPSPLFLATLITNATSAPSTFIFAELLDTPAIQSLRSPETPEKYRSSLTLLEIFAWGTWQEYKSTPNLPTLNTAQIQKLRLLSLLTLAETHNPLTYSIVMESLSLSTPAELETLVREAIYLSLISARLSPTTSPPIIKVNSIAPLRDVRPQTVNTMISILTEWQGRCQDVIGGIEAEIAKILADAERRHVQAQIHAHRVERSLNGWEGDDDGSAGGNDVGGAGSKRSFRPSKDGSGKGGRKFGFGGGNKRFNAASDFGQRNGPPGRVGSEMDVDEGIDGDDSGPLMRNVKRTSGVQGRP
ncbi:COP9 signalosome complex subunit 7a [Coccidioides immitis RS]|uniref:COP9 signalosome complex subunit 7a n=3 Tax=Coccidioides immitis TaxID=5501 RepID=J3KHB9_COCIM|nr:COP9 signalosome complex subunit 7a [Coccidioides immitis RS]EAS35237.3 COP9 signalosome complex subunit 7a [Coccidioides immitis RS]KMP00472.1 COP9 signalosome complex subunit 7a [Coccidioides immitis RMSCC 2394]KMU89476.1 COP9 signalosome complex subunit 7a [Coccidioides immitis H538.4]TPX26485.1 hypothetical protein DIZ76_011947 [Coccidioides immitis]